MFIYKMMKIPRKRSTFKDCEGMRDNINVQIILNQWMNADDLERKVD